jgi:hypothetical protein
MRNIPQSAAHVKMKAGYHLYRAKEHRMGAAELNIYRLTNHRDLETINRFIDRYVDREASEDRGDEELMMESLHPDGKPGTSSSFGEDEEWEPALTLTHSISRGLDHPRRAFALYLKAKDERLSGAILCFTQDDKLILGLSLEESSQSDSIEEAKAILGLLMRQFNCKAGVVAVNTPPPRWGREFPPLARSPLTLFYQGT